MNLRVVKKDIDYLVNEFISDASIGRCFAKEESKREEIVGFINEAIGLRKDAFAKINHPDKSNVKASHRAATDEFLQNLDNLYEKLGSMIGAK